MSGPFAEEDKGRLEEMSGPPVAEKQIFFEKMLGIFAALNRVFLTKLWDHLQLKTKKTFGTLTVDKQGIFDAPSGHFSCCVCG